MELALFAPERPDRRGNRAIERSRVQDEAEAPSEAADKRWTSEWGRDWRTIHSGMRELARLRHTGDIRKFDWHAAGLKAVLDKAREEHWADGFDKQVGRQANARRVVS